MVPRVSEEHMCLHGKTNWWENSRNKEGYHSMLNNQGEHSVVSRNQEGCHSMLNDPGEHSVASYFKDTLDMSLSLHQATPVAD